MVSGGAGTRRVRRLLVGGALVCLGGAATSAGAQTVTLEMRPVPGDTVRLRFDQEVEMHAARTEEGVERSMAMVTRFQVHTTAVVLKSVRDGATISASTDSAQVWMSDGSTGDALRGRLLRGRVLMHVSPNGKTRMMQNGGIVSPELSALFAQMPALLPARPVQVGGSWAQSMAVPLSGQPGGPPAGMVRATFQLDSLSDNGDIAFISMRGSLSRSPVITSAAGLPTGVTVESTGTVAGAIEMDRRRGWMSAARVIVTTLTTYMPPSGAADTPMRVRTRSTQTLRLVDAR